MKYEATLKAALMKELRRQLPHFVHQRHEDRYTAGWPDISVTGNRRTSFWEVKHATPDWSSRGIQELMMARLAKAAFCANYIFYLERKGVKRTLIVAPCDIITLDATDSCEGFSHQWLAEQIRRRHDG